MTNAAGNSLLSVYDKTGIVEFARGLDALGWKLYASGGTAKVIAEAGMPVTDVAELVGGGAILGHRVVTLSREIAAGIIAGHTAEDDAELAQLGIPRIGLVCVDMYPLRNAIKDPSSTEQLVIEKTDIGGPTMLRASAKARGIVLSRANQRSEVLEWLKAGKPNETTFLRTLAAAAEFEVARYVLDSAQYLGNKEMIGIAAERVAVPQYGENRWQKESGLYVDNRQDDPLALHRFSLRQGTTPSYNNYVDIDRLLQTMTHIAAGFDLNYGKVPFAALGVKHGNACGAAVADSPEQATRDMLSGDLRAIFGGSIMLNFTLDETIADLLLTYGVEKGKRLLDVVAASDVTPEALKLLERKGDKLRIIINPELAKLNKNSLDTTRRVRYVRGGLLAQDNYTQVIDFASSDVTFHGTDANQAQQRDLLLAWGVGSTSNSNTITLIKNGMLLGNGVGQQDRVSAAELAIKRAQSAGHDTTDSAAYSDSFFPFEDGPQVLIDAGVRALLTTSGSVRDEKVFQSIEDAVKGEKVALYTIPDELGRGFFNH
jgi:phosphoribosylaminoimidazolecarboxamide formyltransferase/IMP cyclohydrolase